MTLGVGGRGTDEQAGGRGIGGAGQAHAVDSEKTMVRRVGFFSFFFSWGGTPRLVEPSQPSFALAGVSRGSGTRRHRAELMAARVVILKDVPAQGILATIAAGVLRTSEAPDRRPATDEGLRLAGPHASRTASACRNRQGD